MIFNSIQKIASVLCLLISLLAFPAWAETAEQEIERAYQLNIQAILLHQQGKYQEALQLSQQALAIQEKALGPEHADTALSLNNLAELYRIL